ncbi:MAG: molybdopterin-guanine dinucleotide biosynthesis protein B [Betaproteobacteria bacterium]|jgi:molybdopterin-guanine dinucleotide biosynthesis protein B|uniref:Putative Molybdopterin-guanine dinucleotide biosynthesis protein MobB n=2 Tax=Burkholderiales genera incertae sedis TaxID=224471 RepID=A0A238D8V9_THIDL|nr:molybdopterin-guanine dinucleotide biosynthesis protein B [Betaproteobacteria bacterium]SBP89602.1 putative Molybdopterin-guanine dinucleotide biosynthesis protein MobB [Thiomonas delicata]
MSEAGVLSMRVVGFAGYSGSGKTTLVEQLVGHLRLSGQKVSVIKHAHHKFDIDYPGKDSWRHRKAGAYEVLVASSHLLALQRESAQPVEYTVGDLLPMLETVDWVFVEGFKHAPIPKIEVWRHAAGKPVCYPDDPHILAIATDDADKLPQPTTARLLDLNQPAAIAQWLLDEQERFTYRP